MRSFTITVGSSSPPNLSDPVMNFVYAFLYFNLYWEDLHLYDRMFLCLKKSMLCLSNAVKFKHIQIQIPIQQICKSYIQMKATSTPVSSPTHNTPPVSLSKQSSGNISSSSGSIKCKRSLYKDLKHRDEQHKKSEEWCVYLIISADMDNTYVGVTTNFRRRLRQHNGELNGGAKASRAGRPWQCVCLIDGFKDRSEACHFEWKWKHFSRNLSRKSNKSANINCQTGYFASPLVQHRQAALEKVKDSIDCHHLKVQWQEQLSNK